jgi:hypothetical protein
MMIFGAFGFTLFPTMALFTVYCSENVPSVFCSEGIIYTNVILCSVLVGLMSANLWVAQSRIMTDLCSVETLGKYFGLFWAIMQLS